MNRGRKRSYGRIESAKIRAGLLSSLRGENITC